MDDIDVGAVYAEGRCRVEALVADLPHEQATMTVPACPDWRVQDLVAHMSGVCADVLAGRLDGAGTDPWTATQVSARYDRDLSEIVAEWNENAPRVEAVAQDFGPAGRQLVFDFFTHEQDLRGALGAPGARDCAACEIALEFIVPGFEAAAARSGLRPLRLVTGSRVWAPAGVESAEPTETLTIEPFEFLRAATGRRSATQIRAFDWSTDPEPYLAAFTVGPFTPRSTDLVE